MEGPDLLNVHYKTKVQLSFFFWGGGGGEFQTSVSIPGVGDITCRDALPITYIQVSTLG